VSSREELCLSKRLVETSQVRTAASEINRANGSESSQGKLALFGDSGLARIPTILEARRVRISGQVTLRHRTQKNRAWIDSHVELCTKK
jgi:hypothetical protein